MPHGFLMERPQNAVNQNAKIAFNLLVKVEPGISGRTLDFERI